MRAVCWRLVPTGKCCVSVPRLPCRLVLSIRRKCDLAVRRWQLPRVHRRVDARPLHDVPGWLRVSSGSYCACALCAG